MIKVVIFDFDDTLCLTEEACFNFENEIAKNMGFPPMTRSVHQKSWGIPLVEAIVERIPGIDVDEFMKRQKKSFSNYMLEGNFDKVSEENLKVLDKLKKAGKKLAILTNRDFSDVRHLLHEKHPLSSKIEAFYHKDNVDYIKPDPRVFNNVLYKFDVTPRDCAYVGDALGDCIAAKGAGMHFIAVLESGIRTRKYFADHEVDFFADKFVDIVDYILQS